MRINDILTETRSDEGIVSDIGSGVGKAVGATARGVSAVAGGIRGAWDAAKQGFQAGRNAVAGGGANNANTQKAQTLRAQADQLDGGNSAQQMPSPQSGGRRNSGTGGQSRPYTGGRQAATAADLAVAAASPDAALEKLQQALQHLKGPDVERIRAMLKKRAGIAEGVMSSVAGGLGKMNQGYVNAKSAYQKGRGGDMTPQEIDLALASMPKEQAAELLNFFDTLYPAVAAGSPTPAASAAPTTPAVAAGSPTPAASAAPTTPASAAPKTSFQAAGSATPNNVSFNLPKTPASAAPKTSFQAAGSATGSATPNNVSFNLPKTPAVAQAAAAPAAAPKTPPPTVRQTIPNPPAAKSINGLNLRSPTPEGQLHSSFLGIVL